MRRYQDIIIKMAEETETMTNNTYYQNNKQKIQDQYAAKRDDKLAYQIEYNLINRDKYLDYQKSYYESKKDEILRMKRILLGSMMLCLENTLTLQIPYLLTATSSTFDYMSA